MIETTTATSGRALWRAALLALILALVLAAPARAEVESSEITSPADPTYLFEDTTAATGSLTIKGTTTGSGKVDINCYTANTAETVKEEVPTPSNKFSVTVKVNELPQLEEEQPCVLRAVPEGSPAPHPPGESSPAFKGPRLAISTWALSESSKLVYDHALVSSTLAALAEIDAPGNCGLERSLLYDPSSLAESEALFICNPALVGQAIGASGELHRSEIQVDGQNAYDSYTAAQLFGALKPSNQFPPLTLTKSFDPATGLTTVHEVDPIVECVGKAPAFPETKGSCESFRSAGVQLERSWRPADANHVVDMADVWRSSDGAAHALSLLYDQGFADNKNHGGGTFEFPGKPGFVETLKSEPVTLPPGANALYYKSDATTPAGGDAEHKHPQGAVVYDRAPSEPLNVFTGSKELIGKEVTPENGFLMPYQASVPAGGTWALRMSFITAFALSEAHSLAEGVIASFPPSITITSPAGPVSVASSPVTVTGTAADTGAIASVTVNGVAATLAADGSWSASVPLAVGANTLTATVTDDAGMTSTATGAVTYAPPPPAGGGGAAAASSSPAAHAARVGSIRTNNGRVTLTLACTGAAGQACRVGLLLSTTEKLKGTRVTGLSARSKVLKLTGATVSIAAGSRATVTLKPNATGRSLLARFGRLPARLAASDGGGRLFSTALTIKPPPKRHH